jgi:hypothetical protein
VTTSSPPARPEPRPPARWLLWTAALGPLALWFAYFMAAYLYTEAACGVARGAAAGRGLGPDAVLLVATLGAVAISGALTYLAHRLAGRTARTAPAFDDFLPRLGRVVGLLVTFVLAAHLVPVLWLGACR